MTAKHTLLTRIAHAGLASAIVFQLGTSLFMQPPWPGHEANFGFELHEFGGVAALGFALLFWAVILTRIVGTDVGRLFPWFSATRRAALKADAATHWRAVKSLSLPAYDPEGALASSIHGLGLLLMTYMGASGTMYVIASQIGYEQSSILHLAMELHGILANLVWAYLIGHAGLGLLHQIKGDFSLSEMWSFKSNSENKEIAK